MLLTSLRRALLLGALLCFSIARAQDTTRFDALLWRISGNGLPKPSYLYGTMHVSNKLAFHLSEEFFGALEGADVVALEMDPSTWLPEMCRSDWFAGLARLRGLGDSNKDLYNTVFSFEAPDRSRIEALLAQDPETVNSLLYRISERGAEHEENTFLDLFIYQCGRKMGKRVIGLEQFEGSMRMYVKAMVPSDEDMDEDELMAKRRKLFEQGLDPQQLTEDAYRAQDLTRMDTLFEYMMPQANTRKYLLNERNKGFVEHMLVEMRKGSLFTGVGAAHLPGRNGVIHMLRDMGYTVEPVYGHVTDRSKARRDKLEGMGIPMPLTTYWTADSTFKLDLPSPLCELPQGMDDGVRTALAVDNVNGGFYSVQRIPTFAGMQGITPEQLLDRIDSALYEAVPGHIDHRKRIVADNGWPGLELRSTTSKNRHIHYRILVGPLEIVVFKRGGKGNKLADKQGEKVFASIHAGRSGASPATWTPQRAGCTVATAGLRLVEDQQPEASRSVSAERTAFAVSTDPRSGANYLFAAATYPDVKYIEQDSFELHVLAERFADGLEVKSLQHRDTLMAGIPACISRGVSAHGDTLRIMTALHGPAYYLLAAKSTSAEAQAYFGSFRVNGPKSDIPFLAHTDALLQFTVRTASPMNEAEDLITDLGNDLMRKLMDRHGKRDNSHRSSKDEVVYNSSVSADAVSVERSRFHRFWSEKDSAEMWDRVLESLADEGKMRISRKTLTRMDGGQRLDLLLTDTASSRGIRVSILVRSDAAYKLRACVDTAEASNPWLDTFFASFAPLDSMHYEGILAPKGDVFMEWLTGTDTLHARQARDSFDAVKLEDRHAAPLVAYLKASGSKLKEDERKDAVRELSTLHDPCVVPYLKELHAAAGDTLELRSVALRGLVRQHTPAASLLFLKLVQDAPPLSDEKWRVSQLFSGFYDSLSTAVVLFPGIEKLSRFPELESPIRHLKAALMDKALINAPSGEALDQLLQDADAELKRELAADHKPEGTGRFDYSYDSDDDDGAMGRAQRILERAAWTARRNVRTFHRSSDDDDDKAGEIGPRSADMTTYLHLLLPQYADARVKAFFDKVMACGLDDIALETGSLLADHGKAVDASFWARFADRDDTRMQLYLLGRSMGHPEWVPADHLDARRNADAYILSGWKDAAKDSVTFIGVREGRSGFGTGTVYFYKSRVEEDNDDSDKKDKKVKWRLGYTGYYPGTGNDPFAHSFGEWMTEEYTADELEKAMDKAMEDVRYIGRERWHKYGRWDRRWDYID